MQDDFNIYAANDAAAGFARFAYKDTLILDVDDCLYPIDNETAPEKPGLHAEIKKLIIENWNTHASLEMKETLSGFLANNPDFGGIDAHVLTASDLKMAFPQMLRTVQTCEPDKLWDWLDKFYGDNYADILKPDPALVEGLKLWEQTGGRIIFYTNGPSHPEIGGVSHTQKVLTHKGFDEDFIERARPNTQDLIMSSLDGAGKPSEESFGIVIKRFDINPASSLMLDDSVKNLETAGKFGVDGLWTWTSANAPPHTDAVLAAEIRAPRIQDTGAGILAIAQHRKQLLDLGLLSRPSDTPQLMAG